MPVQVRPWAPEDPALPVAFHHSDTLVLATDHTHFPSRLLEELSGVVLIFRRRHEANGIDARARVLLAVLEVKPAEQVENGRDHKRIVRMLPRPHDHRADSQDDKA